VDYYADTYDAVTAGNPAAMMRAAGDDCEFLD
jgi:hypothetical protein